MLSSAVARARALTLELSCVMTNRPFWRKWWLKNTAVCLLLYEFSYLKRLLETFSYFV